MNVAASMIAWGPLESANWTKEVELCLAFADAIDGASLQVARARAAAITNGGGSTDKPLSNATEPQGEAPDGNTKLSDYLERLNAGGPDIDAVVAEIAADTSLASQVGPERDELEAALKAHVRPIPATQAERNLVAYKALARVNPENQDYKEKISQYESAVEVESDRLKKIARQLEGRLVRTEAAFDGSSWSRHPSSPRYQDIRNYVTLYLIESSTGQKSIELFFNYTSRNGWLFVESASINIDGETSSVPTSQWLRDNDSEIWEFASMRGEAAVTLARKIAKANRVVVRFNGQQFYDDYVVSQSDKRVIQEMLAMWDVISAK